MNPTPDPGLVRNLAALDKDLRLRWATHQQVWLAELQVKERQPAWLSEKPSAMGTTPRARDAWDSWRLGRIYVTKFKHPIRFPWEFLAEHLRHLSLDAHQAKAALLERLEAAEAEDEARIKREWAVKNEAGAKEIFDRHAWNTKRQISTHVAADNPLRVEHDGFVTYDRRARTLETA